MATLVDRINEMIDLLTVVNPEAAASFRGSAQPRIVYVTEPKAAAPAVVQPMQPSSDSRQPSSGMSTVSSKPKQAAGGQQHPLLTNLSPESLIDGIILSEILGKPLSRRRPGRR